MTNCQKAESGALGEAVAEVGMLTKHIDRPQSRNIAHTGGVGGTRSASGHSLDMICLTHGAQGNCLVGSGMWVDERKQGHR